MGQDDRPEPSSTDRPPSEGTIRALALLFLRLGLTAFGGPAAHIAMMEHEVVRRRGWLSHEAFLELLGATNLIPGPNSTEMAIHIGHRRGGWPGLLVAGAAFILPAAAITLAFAWAYVRFGALPQVGGVLYGVKPVIIAVVLQALWGLGRSALKTRGLAVIGALAVGAATAGVNELGILFGAGLLVVLGRRLGRRQDGSSLLWALPVLPGGAVSGGGLVPAGDLVPGAGAVSIAAGAAVIPFGLAPLFLFFLKVGSILFGSGYVLLAFLRADLVDRWHWLTEAQLLDAVAVGQLTPGPVFTTATFIGYVLGGLPGAAAATLGIFLPAFFFVAVSGALVPHLRKSPVASGFLDGVIVASLALMAVVTWQLGRAAVVDPITLGITVLSGLLLVRYRVNSAWLVLGGGLLGGWVGGA